MIDSPGYHNDLLRHKALEIIKDELEKTYKHSFSTDEILYTVTNLRTQFADNLRKIKKGVSSGSHGDVEKLVAKVANLDSNNVIEEGEYVLSDGGTLTSIEEKDNEETGTESRPENKPLPMIKTTVTSTSLGTTQKSRKRKADAADDINQSMIDAIRKISEDIGLLFRYRFLYAACVG
ncbi:hypothetical protein RN001_001370 [Aquatica leii]|uniref:Uncharacterized protein n=1 Tax=Aquatica leii TaxID=1421715 RepID=A0AAN7PFX6_9COLE|nr:hypothetical protein RN001_001370 [Aquatica leii]